MNLLLKLCPSDAFMLLTVNVLVQIAVVVALAGAISLVFARHHAAVRHAIWLSALVCVLLSPAAAYVATKADWPLLSLRLLPRSATSDVEAIPSSVLAVADTERLSDVSRGQPPSPVGNGAKQLPSPIGRGAGGEGVGSQKAAQLRSPFVKGKEPAIAFSDANSPHPNPLPKGEGTSVFPRGEGTGATDQWRAMLGLAVVLWAAGAVVLFVRLLHGCWHIARLRRRLRPIGSNRLAILNEVCRALNTNSKALPPLAIFPDTTELAGPITIGLVRPLVVLPQKLLEMLEPDGLRNVLVHEFAHALRHDPLIGFVQRLAAIIYWPYPPVHLLNRRLAWAREEVCDNYVLRQGDAPSYAETLLAISQTFFSKRARPAALGLFHPYGRLERRVAELLDPRRNVMVRTHRVAAAILAVMFLTAVGFVACTRVRDAEPPAAPAAPASPQAPAAPDESELPGLPSEPAASNGDRTLLPGLPPEQAVPAVGPNKAKPADKRQGGRKPTERYSDVVTLDYSGGEVGGNGFTRLPTGYTIVTLSNENAATTEVAVSFAGEQTAPSPEKFHVVARDQQNKLHEPIDESSSMGGGAQLRVTTIVAKFALPQKDLAKLVVQQSGEVASQRMSAKGPMARGYRTMPPPKKRPDSGFQIPASGQSADASFNIIQPFDLLRIDVMGTLPDQLINGVYLVEPDGQVPLGPAYGRVNVKGLTWEQAERKIANQLKRILENPTVQVALARRGSWLWREAVLPKTPYKIGVWDVLKVRVLGTLPDQPIDGFFLVESTGTLALGPVHGRVHVKGLTLDTAEKAICNKLKEVLQKPEVQVAWARSADQKEQWREIAPPKAPYTISPGMLLSITVIGVLLDQPIEETFAVEPTGTVALGPAYGRAQVKGLTLEAAEKAIQKKLKEVPFFPMKPEVQVTFAGWQGENDPLLSEQAARRAARDGRYHRGPPVRSRDEKPPRITTPR